MARGQTAIRTTRGIQQSLIAPVRRQVLSPEERGAIYTKGWVVELMLDLAGYRAEINLVDSVAVEPAAGCGAFLGPMIERLIDSCVALGRPISECADSLVAYELDQESAAHAHALAVKALATRGIGQPLANDLADGWIRTGDYLLEAMGNEADFVIGNPPYVRLEEIPEEIVSVYRDAYPTMRGRSDLYVAFLEASLHQLRQNGVCVFICADRWMRNQYGGDLRGLVTSGYAVEFVIEMHDADVFHDQVDAYPAITVIRRKQQASTVVASAGKDVEGSIHSLLSETLLATARGTKLAAVPGLSTAVVKRWFRGSDPWPCHSPEQLALLRRLEDHFPALESSAKVGIGVATGNDAIFITRDPALVESSRLLKLGLANDICGGIMKWSGHYLVDPWDEDGLVKLENFPMLRAYFEMHAEALKKRHTAVKNRRAWYKTIDRVTHALACRPKLYIADIKNALDPVLDAGETYPHHNLYFVQSDEWDLEVLGGLLLSSIGQFFVESYGVRMRGGYLRFQAQYLRRIRLPAPRSISDSQRRRLVEVFKTRDRKQASVIALEVYGIEESTLEKALGHR